MKQILFSILLLGILSGCSKDSSTTGTNPEDAPLQVVVSELTDKTAVSITVTNQNNVKILDIVNQFGNTTYNTEVVHSKDKLKVHYKCNIQSNSAGDGVGTITFLYKGENRGAAGVSGTIERDITVTIP